MTETDRHTLFAELVRTADFQCSEVTRSVILGTDSTLDPPSVFATVRCSNGDEYNLMIPESGPIRAIECEVLQAVTQRGCWEPL